MNNIIVSHIGARNGQYPFPFLKCFKNDIIVYLFEADKTSINEITQKNKDKYKTKVINSFIGEFEENINFKINSLPHNSSSLQTNNKSNYCLYHGEKDLTAHEAFYTMEEIEVKSTPLSKLIYEKEIEQIDFLSIDTQGTEINILRGLNKNIDEVLCIQTEINFIDLYKNQTNFYDLFKFMKENGFYLIDFFDYKKGSMTRVPIDFRDNGQLIHSDVLFFRDPESILNSNQYSEEKKCIMLIKLIFVSVINNNLDFAYYCFSLDSVKLDKYLNQPNLNLEYQFLVKKLIGLMKDNKVFPDQYKKDNYYSFIKVYSKDKKYKNNNLKLYILKLILFSLSKVSFFINIYRYIFSYKKNINLINLLYEYSLIDFAKKIKKNYKKRLFNKKIKYKIFGKTFII